MFGNYVESSRRSNIREDSHTEIFEKKNAINFVKGKVWNRVVRTHKLSYEALHGEFCGLSF